MLTAHDPLAPDEPDLQPVLDALDDPDCRTILATLDEPMTAQEVSESCDVPLSTTYRKLELLSDATLVEESTEIRADGQHATIYRTAFEAVAVALDETDRTFDIDIQRIERSPEERLADMWTEVRKET
jgi:predicted transcriptional regulator